MIVYWLIFVISLKGWSHSLVYGVFQRLKVLKNYDILLWIKNSQLMLIVLNKQTSVRKFKTFVGVNEYRDPISGKAHGFVGISNLN